MGRNSAYTFAGENGAQCVATCCCMNVAISTFVTVVGSGLVSSIGEPTDSAPTPYSPTIIDHSGDAASLPRNATTLSRFGSPGTNTGMTCTFAMTTPLPVT